MEIRKSFSYLNILIINIVLTMQKYKLFFIMTNIFYILSAISFILIIKSCLNTLLLYRKTLIFYSITLSFYSKIVISKVNDNYPPIKKCDFLIKKCDFSDKKCDFLGKKVALFELGITIKTL